MADEIELKLDAAPAQLDRLRRARWLRPYADGPGEDRKLVSVYYDTDDLALRQERAVLRIRESGGRFVQTFKAENPDTGSGLGRREWECPLKGRKLDLKHAHKKQTGGFNLKKLERSIKPVFETRVNRHVVPLAYRGSKLELAIDQGEIRTGRRRLPIHEVEVELKEGDPDHVIAFGREIAQRLKATYGVRAKAERGFALRESEIDKPSEAQDILLSKTMTAAQAFKVIAMSCLQHFAGNRDAILANDREGVHQMRVGLRRLRAVLSLFKDMLRGPETEAVKDELKWLTEELGPARDMDVLAGEAIMPMADVSNVPAAVEALEDDVIAKRDEGIARAKRAVQSERYRRLVLDTVLWINGGKWTKSRAGLIAGRRDLPIPRFAAQELDRRIRKAVKKLHKVAKLEPRQRHKLRIAIKKLRYATDDFESLFQSEKKPRKAFAAVLKDLQSALGQLNDIRVHGELAKRYAAPKRKGRRAAPKAFAMGELTGREAAKSRALIKTTKHLGKRLAENRPDWK